MTVCGATTRSETKCQRPAGWGTDHVGQGRCKLHAGCSPIKSGRYSKIERPGWKERVDRFEADPDPLNLLPEVALLRAVVEDLIERWESIYGANGAVLAWHNSFINKNYSTPKPRQLPDFSSISQVVDRVGAMVDRIQKYKAEGTISLVTLNRIVEQLGAELIGAAQEAQLDSDTSTRFFKAIERRWQSIRLESGRSGDKRD